MLVHVFRGRSRVHGFTQDQTGDNLPPAYGPWEYVKDLTLQRGAKGRIALNDDEAIAAIEAQGYHLVQVKVVTSETQL